MNGVLEWVVDFIGGTLYYVVVGLGVLAGFAAIRFVGVRILRLPSAKKYWWVGALLLAVGVLARITNFNGLADTLAVLFILFCVWVVATIGVSVEDLDKDMLDGGTDGGTDGDGGGM